MSEKQIVIVLLIGLAACIPAKSQVEEPRESTQVELDPFTEARAYVTAQLRDPESGQFGPFSRGKNGSICGQVNARNGFGGLTGMQPFVYSPNGPAADRLYIYDGSGDWREKGIDAEIFVERGCSIGVDEARALEVRRLLDTL